MSPRHLIKCIKIKKQGRQTRISVKKPHFSEPIGYRNIALVSCILFVYKPCMHEGSCWANFSLRSHTGPKKMNICRQFKALSTPLLEQICELRHCTTIDNWPVPNYATPGSLMPSAGRMLYCRFTVSITISFVVHRFQNPCWVVRLRSLVLSSLWR
jgi:hypothetical protein